ncbi:MAG: arginine deiminase family protein [Anaerolineae bacterium]|nr:arginine deiminase family protein [Candidatus Roseilinea sp.]MDW8449445.1 arginine deiminase family protein [Anaerolineae bacterium]
MPLDQSLISNLQSPNLLPLTPSQPAEWLPARVVLMCEPGIETLFAILQTGAANFLFPFSLAQGREEHRAYRRALESHGVRVIDYREALAQAERSRLTQWAREAVTLEYDAALTDDERDESARQLDAALAALDAGSLVDVILLRPAIRVARSAAGLDPTTRFEAQFTLTPPSPYYTRDPLITTREGVVITRLKLDKRAAENDIAAYVLESLGIMPLYRVQPPGTLEGGDFIPCGDFVLQGQGLLTDEAGVCQCLEHRVYGYVEVAVVEDPRMDMDEMHLDTYFAMLDRDLAMCVESRLSGDEEPAVKVYAPQGTPDDYTYVLTRTTLFSRYLREKGIHVIPFSKAEQLDFAANGLLVAPRRLIGVTRAGEPFAQRLRAAGVEVQTVAFDALSGGYGGPHCSTQVLLRG